MSIATNIIDGKTGSPHISSADMGTIHQAVRGQGSFVLSFGQNLSCTVQDANHVVIGTGAGSLQGLDYTLSAPGTLALQSGSQSSKRNDLIVAHYHRDATSVESISLEVIKGTPTSGTPADPAVPGGIILDGATDAYQKLWRIPITGITVGAPVRLYELLPSMRDSITRTSSFEWKVPFSNDHLRVERVGRIVLAHGNIKFNQSGDLNYVRNNESIPLGYRPMWVNTTILFTHTGSGDGYSVLVSPDGSTSSLGNPRSAYATATGSWLTADPWPAD